jgi:regulator of replication initiation timing
MSEAVKTALMAVMAALLGWSGITTISLMVSVAAMNVELQQLKERLAETRQQHREHEEEQRANEARNKQER